MRLANLNEALTEFGLDSQTDMIEGTALALEAATLELSDKLRTEFDRATVVDIFWVDEKYIIRPNMRAHLKLSSGFVDKTQTITIVAADNWNDLTGVQPVDQFVSVQGNLLSTMDISSYVGWDYEKGKVDVDGATLRRWPWIMVTYTAGFNPDPDDANLYDEEAVPDWLQKLALLGAHNMLGDTIPTKETGIKTPPGALQSAYNSAIARHTRYMPQATTPQTTNRTLVNGD